MDAIKTRTKSRLPINFKTKMNKKIISRARGSYVIRVGGYSITIMRSSNGNTFEDLKRAYKIIADEYLDNDKGFFETLIMDSTNLLMHAMFELKDTEEVIEVRRLIKYIYDCFEEQSKL